MSWELVQCAANHPHIAFSFYIMQEWREKACQSSMQNAVQGVVTYMSPVEVFATAIKFFDRQKVCLIA